MTQPSRAPRPFTGRHMAAIMIAFFAVVIAVNVLMARLASATFGGVVVDNSYVASQQFNGWLDAARADRALGWRAQVTRTGGGVRATLTDRAGRPLAGAHVAGVAEHPLGLREDEALAFREGAPGVYDVPLAPGRWRVKLTVRAGGRTWHAMAEVQ